MQLIGTPSKTSLNGFQSLEKSNQGIVIRDFDNLTDITALSSLDSTGFLSLTNLTSLQSFDGLESLTYTGNLTIDGNNSLTDISALSNLEEVDGFMKINDNALLSDIYALSNIDPTKLSSSYFPTVNIFENPNLSQCHIISICNYLELPAPFTYFDSNSPGCNSENEVSLQCCPDTLTIDWSPVLSGIYESAGTIILNSDIEAKENVTLRHGQDGNITISTNANINGEVEMEDTGCIDN